MSTCTHLQRPVLLRRIFTGRRVERSERGSDCKCDVGGRSIRPGPAALCPSQRKQRDTSQFAYTCTWDNSFNPGNKPMKQVGVVPFTDGDGERGVSRISGWGGPPVMLVRSSLRQGPCLPSSKGRPCSTFGCVSCSMAPCKGGLSDQSW